MPRTSSRSTPHSHPHHLHPVILSTVWHPKNADMFASTSGDKTLKIWDANCTHLSTPLLRIFVLICGLMRRQNQYRILSAAEKSAQTINAHDYEILTCDWNKYNEFMLTTGSVDKSMRTWVRPRPPTHLCFLPSRSFETDVRTSHASPIFLMRPCCAQDIRNPSRPVRTLMGHQFAVRRLKCSPHNPRTIASCS